MLDEVNRSIGVEMVDPDATLAGFVIVEGSDYRRAGMTTEGKVILRDEKDCPA
jgi:hypothetical protein